MDNNSQHPRQEGAQAHADQWHLDKRVPIALIFAILAQTVAGVWWAATLQGTVNELSRRQIIIETQADGDGVEAKSFSERLARMEERAAAQSDTLRRIEAQINVIIERDRAHPRDGYPMSPRADDK